MSSFEEAAIAYVRAVVRAEQAEARIKELEKQLAEKEEKKK
jgi:hypothetical protein